LCRKGSPQVTYLKATWYQPCFDSEICGVEATIRLEQDSAPILLFRMRNGIRPACRSPIKRSIPWVKKSPPTGGQLMEGGTRSGVTLIGG